MFNYEDLKQLNEANKINNCYRYRILGVYRDNVYGYKIKCDKNMTFKLIDLVNELMYNHICIVNLSKLKSAIENWLSGKVDVR